MKRFLAICLSSCLAVGAVAIAADPPEAVRYTGSESCQKCHERFYGLWAPSHHGLAMQPFTVEFARTALSAQPQALAIGGARYRAEVDEAGGRVLSEEPSGKRSYPITHALGGKNIYYFLTALDRGRLQVLPVAYDVNGKEWFDTASSAMRHFADAADSALDWREPPFTFNTSCFGCHVSQFETNYDLATNTYSSSWTEPGINCETCHGPAAEHVRVCEQAPEGQAPADLEIISTRVFDHSQTNSLCATCHGKGSPLSTTFPPGERYFDHFDLTTLEDPDFYPDGRDLGENYTYTSWLMSPCVRASTIDCVHCHTSSGRYRHADDPDQSCLPCHAKRVAEAAAHSRHEAGSKASRCISCHMPKSWFARMARHDHSMLPPTPATTVAFESPNACNLCHTDRDPAWADGWVRKWRERDYQAPVIRRAGLIEAARKQDWSRLPEMLAYVASPDRDEVFATALIRLTRSCPNDAKWPVLIAALEDRSPLVRASAADALGDSLTRESLAALVGATSDGYRLVRVRAAAALAAVPPRAFTEQTRSAVESATAELQTSLTSRPDDAFSHYNLGNLHLARGEPSQSIASFETALRLREDFVPAMVNSAHAYVAAGQQGQAEEALRRAIRVDPGSAAAHYNLGLLLGELGRNAEAREALRAALRADPKLAAAAFNLGVLLADEDLDETLHWCKVAAELRVDEPKYAYTLAFYQVQAGDSEGAIETLEKLIERRPGYSNAYAMLGSVFEESGQLDRAYDLYRSALDREELTEGFKNRVAARLRSIGER